MRASGCVAGFAVLLALCGQTRAQKRAQGFAVERLYTAAPGAGWFVMDALDLQGGIGGAIGLTLGYAKNPLRVTDGVNRVAVVSDQAFAELAAALTYRRWRFYLDLDTPIAFRGQGGVVGDYSYSGPSVDFGANPDALSDARIGADVRIWGRRGSHLRLGAGAQLLIPFGNRADYDTDGTFRGMIRALAAGDARNFTYAALFGVHVRPLDESSIAGNPKGSELLFGAAAGAKLAIGRKSNWIAVVGPELYGATAFRSFLGSSGTALEALATARVEGTRDDRAALRVKLGAGGGINHHFGAAEWRLIAGVELFGARATLRR